MGCVTVFLRKCRRGNSDCCQPICCEVDGGSRRLRLRGGDLVQRYRRVNVHKTDVTPNVRIGSIPDPPIAMGNVRYCRKSGLSVDFLRWPSLTLCGPRARQQDQGPTNLGYAQAPNQERVGRKQFKRQRRTVGGIASGHSNSRYQLIYRGFSDCSPCVIRRALRSPLA